jgi:hypothetical protein
VCTHPCFSSRHALLSKTQLEAALPRVGPPGKDEILIGYSTDQLKKTLPALLNGVEKGLDIYGEAEPPGELLVTVPDGDLGHLSLLRYLALGPVLVRYLVRDVDASGRYSWWPPTAGARWPVPKMVLNGLNSPQLI